MKKIGIVCDNYKLEKMKTELIGHGFEEFEEIPYFGDTTAIKIPVTNEEFEEKKKTVFAIVNLVEYHFKRSN
mgnify:CR=1 FL=1